MADNQANANPPASSGGITSEQLQAAIAGAIKPFQDKLEAMEQNHKILADTLAAQKPLAAEDVEKLITQKAAGLVESKFTEAQKAAAKTAARQKVVDELKAKGVADEIIAAHVPDSDDAAALTAAAEKAVARWNEIGPKAPDLGGAAKDGGKKPGEGDVPAKVFHGLSDGVAKYAAELQMPGQAK